MTNVAVQPKLHYEIKREEYVGDPRKEWDHAATMVCWHRRYSFGDEHGFADPDEFYEWVDERRRSLHLGKKAHRWADLIILPLYVMDHSGVSMRTDYRGFQAADSHGWDWGQVGFIYITPDKIREIFELKPEQRITALVQARAYALLRAEVAEYDQFLVGDVWYYVIEDDEGNVIDSCGGIFGYDEAVRTAEEALRDERERQLREAGREASTALFGGV